MRPLESPSPRVAFPFALAVAAAAIAGPDRAAAQEPLPPAESLFAVRPVTLELTDAFAPAARAAAGQPGDSLPPPVRIDALFGSIVPFEESGTAFGQATSDEDFEAGPMFGIRVQGWLHHYLRMGGEIDFASHDVDGGDVFFPGHMDRIYLLAPLTFEVPFGDRRRPFAVGLTVAPGLQVALPDMDDDLEDFQAFNGRFVDQEDFAAFTLRLAAAARFPITYQLRVVLEASYDWAYGEGEVVVHDAFGRVVDRRTDEIDLSSLNVFVGLSFVF